jgi:hypothetical protein
MPLSDLLDDLHAVSALDATGAGLLLVTRR